MAESLCESPAQNISALSWLNISIGQNIPTLVSPKPTGQSRVNQWAPIRYIILQMIWSTDPSKNVFKKTRTHKMSMIRPSNRIYCGWQWGKYFYNQRINKVTPHFTFMRRAQNADTHALKQHRLSPKYFPPSAPVLYWLSHLTCISSLKAKDERKTLIYTQLKIFRYKQHLFAILRNWPPTYLL